LILVPNIDRAVTSNLGNSRGCVHLNIDAVMRFILASPVDR